MTEPPKIPFLSLAEVQASSELPAHPIVLAFDEGHGPGATRWIAGDPGEQTITVAFRQPCTLEEITLEVEEREVARTQAVHLSLSTDGGLTYHERVRQEFTFSPDGATWEQEHWIIRQDHVSHVRLLIKPDKGRSDLHATLTSLVLRGYEHSSHGFGHSTAKG
jgi:hypothetical protein